MCVDLFPKKCGVEEPLDTGEDVLLPLLAGKVGFPIEENMF
jgi:hypothetical protein